MEVSGPNKFQAEYLVSLGFRASSPGVRNFLKLPRFSTSSRKTGMLKGHAKA